jgi:hypothetical protein
MTGCASPDEEADKAFEGEPRLRASAARLWANRSPHPVYERSAVLFPQPLRPRVAISSPGGDAPRNDREPAGQAARVGDGYAIAHLRARPGGRARNPARREAKPAGERRSPPGTAGFAGRRRRASGAGWPWRGSRGRAG